MRLISSFLVLIFLIGIFYAPLKAYDNSFHHDRTIIDIEDITDRFRKQHQQTVHIINHLDSPVYINKASVADRGTRGFEELKDAVNTFATEVSNVSGRNILAYQLTWTMKFPFADYVTKKITENSIDLLKANHDQHLEFRKDKFHRDDVYYYVEVTKVEFDDDESIWEAPESKTNSTSSEIIQQEIDSIKEESLEEIDIEKLKEKYGTVNHPKKAGETTTMTTTTTTTTETTSTEETSSTEEASSTEEKTSE